MESLSQQLERLGNALKERRQKDATLQAQKSGSTADAGKMTPLPEPEQVLPPKMLVSSLPATLGQAAALVAQNAASGMLKPTASLPNMPKRHSASEKQRLAAALGQICKLQRQYGKTEAELETLVEGICWILPDYTMDAILNAIQVYVRMHADIPAPADIEAIINPPLPKPDWAAYVALKKRCHDGDWLFPDERRFLRDCEEYAKKHHADEMDNYRQAQRDIDSHHRITA